MMAGRIAYGCSQGWRYCWLSAQRSVRGCRPLRTRRRRSGIAQATLSYGSTQQARTITVRETVGTVARSAVFTLAKLRPTKTACAPGQVQNERLWQVELLLTFGA